MTMTLLEFDPPRGTAWELLVAVVVVLAGPLVFERLRIPGLVGLLVGGCVIGPNVLGVVSDASGIVDSLGEVGLLYLMFVAGLELDLAVFARYRVQAVGFAMLTFTVPFALGVAGGLLVDYDTAAAVLLGSLFASYTLVVYPVVRKMGLAANRAVAVAVGATVITDTLALVVLAAVSGSATGDAGGAELAVRIAFGLAVISAYCFLVLPKLAGWLFAGPGRARTLRYVFVLFALLSSGVLAETTGIEPIVGAFLAGLALNRLVPNDSEFMERIEFFGSALLVPMFLVSVGTVIDPTVLVDTGTLGLAAAFVAACVGGKLVAATVGRWAFGFTWDEVGVVFGLSVAQAAATLAATFVGLQVGLFNTATVNAVMIVIVVSLVLASVSAERFGARVPRPPLDVTRLGRSVVVHVTTPATTAHLVRLGEVIARADGGVVHPVFVLPDGDDPPGPDVLAALHETVAAESPDAELDVHPDRSVHDGLSHAAKRYAATLVVVSADTQSWLPTLLSAQHQLVSSVGAPTVLLRPGTAMPTRVVLAFGAAQARHPSGAAFVAARLAARLRQPADATVVVSDAPLADDLAAECGSTTLGSPLDWVREHGRPTDLLVVPGGRNGALAAARLVRAAVQRGCTVLTTADPESVAATATRPTLLGTVGRTVSSA